MIKDILFDLDGVFNNIPKDNNYMHYFLAAEKVARLCGLKSLKAEEIKARWNNSQKSKLKYEMSIDVLVHEFAVDYKVAHDLIHQVLLEDHMKLYKGNYQLADQLRHLDKFDLHIVTHANKQWTDYWLNRLDIADYFTSIFLVKDLGLCKAHDESTYPHILNALDKQSNEVIMIDDSATNLVKSSEIGIRSILFSESTKDNDFEQHFNPTDLRNSLLAA